MGDQTPLTNVLHIMRKNVIKNVKKYNFQEVKTRLIKNTFMIKQIPS